MSQAVDRAADHGNEAGTGARPGPAGDPPPGGVTIYDVARHAGVSIATVSRALNASGQVAPATRERIEVVVRRLGYRPNTIARSLATRATRALALLLPDITNPFFPELVKGVQDLADERRYAVLLGSLGDNPRREARYAEILRAKQVDGALLVGGVLGGGLLLPLVADGLPVVALDREAGVPGVPVVRTDHREGVRLVTGHLLTLGHRRVAYLAGTPSLPVTAERVAGWRDAHAAAGIPADPGLLLTGGYSEEDGFAAAHALLDRHPHGAGQGTGQGVTAILAANDSGAIGVLAALAERGVAVPGDVSVVGFDDIGLARRVTPPLTTVRQPVAELGRRATELLLDAIAAGRPAPDQDVILPPELVVRASSGPPVGGRRG